jgi:hypothetical protein
MPIPAYRNIPFSQREVAQLLDLPDGTVATIFNGNRLMPSASLPLLMQLEPPADAEATFEGQTPPVPKSALRQLPRLKRTLQNLMLQQEDLQLRYTRHLLRGHLLQGLQNSGLLQPDSIAALSLNIMQRKYHASNQLHATKFARLQLRVVALQAQISLLEPPVDR